MNLDFPLANQVGLRSNHSRGTHDGCYTLEAINDENGTYINLPWKINISIKIAFTPWKINMEPENHITEKEHHLNQTSITWGSASYFFQGVAILHSWWHSSA